MEPDIGYTPFGKRDYGKIAKSVEHFDFESFKNDFKNADFGNENYNENVKNISLDLTTKQDTRQVFKYDVTPDPNCRLAAAACGGRSRKQSQ